MMSLSRKEAVYEGRQDELKVTRVEGHNEEAVGDFEETMHRTSSSNFRRPLDELSTDLEHTDRTAGR